MNCFHYISQAEALRNETSSGYSNKAMPHLKILIVDDEKLARKRIDDALATLSAALPHDVVGHADNGQDALAMIDEEEPDVVLLDIQMPGMSGIELANTLAKRTRRPAIVFLTAYNQYAMDAFDVQATDYLLKPVKEERLLVALQKAQAWKTGQSIQRQGTHIPAQYQGQKCMLDVRDIVAAQSHWKYIKLHVAGKEYLSEWTLQRLEEEHSHLFCRIHRATLVNIHYVRTLEKQDNDDNKWNVAMRDMPEHFPISRRLLPDVKQRLSSA